MELFDACKDESNKRCGEIFLINKGNIMIHCTLCEGKYKNFDTYARHLSDKHLESIEGVSGSLEQSVSAELHSFENKHRKNDKDLKLDPLINTSKDIKIKLNSDFEIISSFKQKRNLNNILSKSRKKPKRHTGVIITNNLDDESKNSIDPNITSIRNTSKQSCQILSKLKRCSTNKIRDCTECRKVFKATTDRLHTCERKYLCYNCGRSFLSSSHLNRHLKRHQNQRDFKCNTCDKAFYDSQGLRRHMEGHSTERPFNCKECLATFSRETALKNHVKLHENKREYKCNLCSSRFNQHAGLFTHMKLTHKAA